MDDNPLNYAVLWLQRIAKGDSSCKLEVITMAALLIIEADKGFIRCNFTVPSLSSDSDGNWHVGAMATLIDCVGAAAVYSTVGNIHVSLDFTISYFATAKIEEQVEIEAKVAGSKGSLTSVLVQLRKKENGQLIALGKQWMASTNLKNSKL